MDMSGEKRINAPRAKVWEALNDPAALKASIPGCESLEKLSATEFSAKVVLAVGPVKARFAGDVTLADLDPPNGYTLSGQGSGGVAGFGKGEAKITLREDDGATVIAYQVHASVGGKIAQVGQRLIDSTAKKLADQFFEKFSAHVETGAEAVAEKVADAPAPAGPAPTRAPKAATGTIEEAWAKPEGAWGKALILFAGGIVALAVIALLILKL